MTVKNLRLVQVTWRDHSADKGSGGWEKLSELSTREEVIAQSVGWLVKEDDKHIVLASAISDDYGASIQIVLKGVVTDTIELSPTVLANKLYQKYLREMATRLEIEANETAEDNLTSMAEGFCNKRISGTLRRIATDLRKLAE